MISDLKRINSYDLLKNKCKDAKNNIIYYQETFESRCASCWH